MLCFFPCYEQCHRSTFSSLSSSSFISEKRSHFGSHPRHIFDFFSAPLKLHAVPYLPWARLISSSRTSSCVCVTRRYHGKSLIGFSLPWIDSYDAVFSSAEAVTEFPFSPAACRGSWSLRDKWTSDFRKHHFINNLDLLPSRVPITRSHRNFNFIPLLLYLHSFLHVFLVLEPQIEAELISSNHLPSIQTCQCLETQCKSVNLHPAIVDVKTGCQWWIDKTAKETHNYRIKP